MEERGELLSRELRDEEKTNTGQLRRDLELAILGVWLKHVAKLKAREVSRVQNMILMRVPSLQLGC
jgi:hypothetical protein